MNLDKRVEQDQCAKVYAYVQAFMRLGLHTDESVISSNLAEVEKKWPSFMAEYPRCPGTGNEWTR
jgi:hypothetical protein